MDTSLLHATIIWAVLGLGLGCLVLRLIPRRPPEPEGHEGFGE